MEDEGSLLDDLQKMVELTGKISQPGKPESFGGRYVFPEDLTKLGSEQLGQWMSRISAYRSYIGGQLAMQAVKRRMLKAHLDIVIAEESRKIDDSSRTQKSIKEEVMLIPDIKSLNRRYTRADSQAIYFEHLLNVYQGQIEVISREISRRRDESFQ